MRAQPIIGALVLAALPLGAATCGGSQPVYRGDPKAMVEACERAKVLCPPNEDWMKCHDDQWECHRLGLWYEDGIKVTRSAARAEEIFNAMCDRLEFSSCRELCDDGQQARCVDGALLAVAAAGGAPYPPSFEPYREVLEKGCQQQDPTWPRSMPTGWGSTSIPSGRPISSSRLAARATPRLAPLWRCSSSKAGASPATGSRPALSYGRLATPATTAPASP